MIACQSKFSALKFYIQILAEVLSESRYAMAWAGFQVIQRPSVTPCMLWLAEKISQGCGKQLT